MITSRPGGFHRHLAGLCARPGEGAVAETLADLAERAVEFFRHAMPLGNSLLAEPEMLGLFRLRLAELEVGPRKPLAMLAGYLRAEQDLGRIRPHADPEALAALLLGACFHRAFLDTFLDDSAGDVPRFARSLVNTLLPSLVPGPASGAEADAVCARPPA